MSDLENNENNENNKNNENNENNKNKLNLMNKFIFINSFSSICSVTNICENVCEKTTDTVLSVISLSSIAFGLFQYFTDDTLTAIGYVSSGIFSGATLVTLKRMRLRASLSSSVDVLKDENEELKESNDKLAENVTDLEELKEALDIDLKILKETIGIVGENSDALMNNLKELHSKLHSENEMHSRLLKTQTHLQLLNIFYQFSKTHSLKLNKNEIILAKEHILNILHYKTWENIEELINNQELKLKELIKLIN